MAIRYLPLYPDCWKVGGNLDPIRNSNSEQWQVLLFLIDELCQHGRGSHLLFKALAYLTLPCSGYRMEQGRDSQFPQSSCSQIFRTAQCPPSLVFLFTCSCLVVFWKAEDFWGLFLLQHDKLEQTVNHPCIMKWYQFFYCLVYLSKNFW